MGFSQKILLSTTQKMNLTTLSEVYSQLLKIRKILVTYVVIHVLK